MNNSFFIEDFTEEKYRETLLYCKEKFEIINYPDIMYKKGLLWRHDVDASIHRSFKLSEIEKASGINSTYFLHLHSEYYNLFEREVHLLVNRILENGHSIGLHFDPGFYADKIKSKEDLEHYITKEALLLEDLFKKKVESFSFHNPDIGDFLKYDEFTYAGLINTYSSFLKENVKYCSDSNGYWRYKRLSSFLEECTNSDLIQVLTHPEWWTPQAMMPRDRIIRCIDGRAEKLINSYDAYFNNSTERQNIGK